ncbi:MULTISPECIES: type II toxin-antitoxin system VapC family toxin [Haloferax]|uniref:PIN domain-containing protein n=2 Tax=Haloferax TaxID=2251 RepID=A0A6G1Z217_9EURY|nr:MULTISPECIES: type II toxin-antitoxin system VapC family toxin [Haloferax]KAB1187863.1 type II toxin-antitoxin system VapC family toxin [Haloferax sp. CBA1149]MRW80525.1 PIN domain-containing protein [Haloferax marinisediminis]
MTFLDSSVIIDYLDGVKEVVEFVDEQPTVVTSSICICEVLAGEVFSVGEADLIGARENFGRVTALDFSEEVAFEAARMQNRLLESGNPMSPRDLMIAATARSEGKELVVSDADFDTEGLRELLSVRKFGPY